MTETTLSIEGMTCASCVARVEKRLMRLEGVTAEVNLATEKARVTHPETVDAGQLTAAVASAGYTATVEAPVRAETREEGPDRGDGPRETGAGATTTTLRTRLVVSAILSVPVIALAMVPAWQFDNWQWLSLVLAAPVVVWGGYPFHRATVVNLRHGALTMDTLVTLGTGAALLWSVWALFLGTAGMPGMTHAFTLFPSDVDPSANIYLETAAGVTVFLLLGREIERASRARAGDALRELLSLGAKDVTVLRDGEEATIPIERLAVGDVFLVRPGETVATDGVVIDGAAAVDESMITGESVPVEVGEGDAVTGGTIAGDGRLVVRAASVGDDTRLARMARLVEDAQLGKGRVQRLADRVSAVFVPIVIGISVLSFAGWLLAGGTLAAAFTAAVAVLIIACPCALGLATPVALLVGTSRGARLGILISSADALERAHGIDTVVLDKTGTVTTGEMSVTRVVAAPGRDERRLRDLTASLEAASEHPIARAIAGISDARLHVEAFASTPARGVSGVVEGATVVAGSRAFVDASGASWPDGLADAVAEAEGAGESVTVVAVDGEASGLVAVADTARPDAASAVAAMRRLGLEPVLLTGDNEHVARRVADEAGIREVGSRQSPEDKVRRVRALQEDGRVVAMVGDGVNDAAALAAADLGMAMGSGTDVAIAASDITILRHDLGAIADAVRLSRRTIGVIRGNLFWAFAYNVAAIPLAAFGLLNPMIAGAAMAFSSVFVVLNSLRLRGFRSASAGLVSASAR